MCKSISRCAAAMLLLVLAFPSGAAEPEKSPGRLQLAVVESQTRQPLAAEVKVSIGAAQATAVELNARGEAEIELGTEYLSYLSITARKEGFVPTRVSWRNIEGKQTIPDRFILELEPATRVSGIVRDDQGHGIASATVHLIITGLGKTGVAEPLSQHEATTDAEGRWTSRTMPASVPQLYTRLSHPDFLSDRGISSVSASAMEALRAGTHILQMKKGIEVTGTVTDAAGKPIAGANVVLGPDRFGSSNPKAQSDHQGHFRIAHAPAGPSTLTVQAGGYAPDLRQVTVAPGAKAVEFKLEPGRTIRGQLVGPTGEPVPGAMVVADTWRGNRSLDYHINSDFEGRFEWTDAPADPVLFDMGGQGHQYVRRYSMTARDEPYIVKLPKPLVVRGHAIDDETGAKVEKFKLIPGILFEGRTDPLWEFERGHQITDGQFRLTFSEQRPGHLVRIEADGYIPAVSKIYRDNDGEQVFEAKLRKGAAIAGVVKLPDGRPAKDAQVTLCTAGNMAYVQNGRFLQSSARTPTVGTDAEGRFQFPPETQPYVIMVLHDAGSARLERDEFEKSPEIALQPWAKVTGQVMISAKPGANEPVSLYYDERHELDRPRVHFDYKGRTDEQGRFAIERCVPGAARVSRVIITKTGGSGEMHSPTHSVPVALEPGKTAEVTIGGMGRPVVGRIALPDDREPGTYSFAHNSVTRRRPHFEPPANSEQMTLEEQRALYEEFRKSPVYQAYERSLTFFPFQVAADGSFRVEDVPAGEYTLGVSISEPPSAAQCGFGDSIGSGGLSFTMPEIPGGRSDEPLDVGTVTLTMMHRIKAGQAAPPFEAKTLDGKPIKLSDYKGKYVLLDFWATWCGPCVAETPHLKEAYEAFSNDPRFVMIGLSLDQKEDAPRNYAQKNSLGWTQAFLGEWSRTTIPKEYGITGIPSMWLIGPDGKVIAKDLRGAQIKATLERELAGK